MVRAIPYLAATVLVVLVGYIHGSRTNRWSTSHDLQDAVARLQDVPLDIGDWAGQSEELDDDRVLKAAGIEGSLSRAYTHRGDGRSVSIMIVCGRPGPIAVHTPDICYTAAGFELQAPPRRVPIPPDSTSSPAEFWSGDFEKRGPTVTSDLRILWAWSAQGVWRAPDNPRLEFASYPFLYKLYVIHATGRQTPTDGDPVSMAFLKDVLPVLQKTLFPGRIKEASSTEENPRPHPGPRG